MSEELERIRQHLAQGEYVQAAATGRALFAVSGATPLERGEAAWLAAEAMHALRQYPGAAQMAEQALRLAREAGARNLTGRCAFRLCGALVGVGDSTAALEAGRQFLQGLEAGEWPELGHLKGRCQTNLGMAHKARRQFADAMEQLTHSLAAFTHIPLADGQTDLRGIVKARHLLAWMLTDLDRAPEAEVHLEAARELIPLMPDWAEHQQAHTAYLRLRQRRRGEAALCAMELLAPDRRDVSAANRAIGHYVMGCVLLEAGDPEGAQRHCMLGQSLAAASEVPAVMNLLMDLVRKLRAPA